MLHNYIITAIRNIRRDGYYSVIKIIGLALGLGTSLVLFLYVSHQLSFDREHPDAERLYRVNQTNIWDPAGGKFSSTGVAVGLDLVNNYPDIEEVVRINTPGPQLVSFVNNNGEVISFNEQNTLAADSNFFSFFSFRLKEGDYKTSLIGSNKVVLSDKAALRLFGDEPAVGKLLQVGDEKITVEVTGVTQAQPSNIHFNFDYLFSMSTNPAVKNFEWSWIFTQVVTYLKLKPHVNPHDFSNKILRAPDIHAKETFKKLRMDYEEFKNERGAWELYIQPVTDIHLYSTALGNRIGPTGNIRNVTVLGVIGVFILLIAIINFVNLSTARAANRAKEVGVKKTLGWTKFSLIAQFQVEHILLTIISMLFGFSIMELMRIILQPLTGLEIPLTTLQSPMMIAILIALPAIIGFFAGLYPSFYLTAFRPAEVLKGKISSGLRSSFLRNGLVVFQFTVSIALIAATVIIFSQVDFFRSQDIGFDKENLLIVKNVEKIGSHMESFRDEIVRLNGVESASLCREIRSGYQDLFLREGDQMKLPINVCKIDEHFFETTKLSISSGRAFDEREADKNSVIINETTARLFDWSAQEAIGKRIIYVGDEIGPQEVIGVVKDFHFSSLRENIQPLIFFNVNSDYWGPQRIVMIKYSDANPSKLIHRIQKQWITHADAIPFDYSFYHEDLKRQYQSEEMLGSLFGVFTALSITIAIIGLVGLAAYSAEQRKKEIGIRKVFGASFIKIYVMMNFQYFKLILIALLIATPLTWLLMQQWLNGYSYRIEISPWIFVFTGLSEILIALICVGYIALRAATLNPANVLKEQ